MYRACLWSLHFINWIMSLCAWCVLSLTILLLPSFLLGIILPTLSCSSFHSSYILFRPSARCKIIKCLSPPSLTSPILVLWMSVPAMQSAGKRSHLSEPSTPTVLQKKSRHSHEVNGRNLKLNKFNRGSSIQRPWKLVCILMWLSGN